MKNTETIKKQAELKLLTLFNDNGTAIVINKTRTCGKRIVIEFTAYSTRTKVFFKEIAVFDVMCKFLEVRCIDCLCR